MKTTTIKNSSYGIFSFVILSTVCFASYDFKVERHTEPNQTKVTKSPQLSEADIFTIKSYESELSEIEKSATKLEIAKERTVKNSARYVDLDKNLADIYVRINIARKYIHNLKRNSVEITDTDRRDLETLLVNIREIINTNAQTAE